MKRLVLSLLATTLAAPALAQHGGHAQPPAPQAQTDPHSGHVQPAAPATQPASPPACTPEHAAMGHCTMAPATPSPAAPPPPACPPEHAAMGHCTPAPTQAADPHSGHAMPAAPERPAADPHSDHAMPPPDRPTQPDPHAGHTMPPTGEVEADPHSGQQTGTSQTAPAPPVAPPPPEALSGPAHAADAVFGAGPMQAARDELRETHGDIRVWRLGVDQLEAAFRNGHDGYSWEDLHFWYGGDLDKLWIKSEGEGAFGEGLERAEVQALWSRGISPFFDLQTGIRYDFGPQPDRGHLVLGVQGLAPYWFEIDTALFLSERGHLTARFEGEYDQRMTQRLILQPRAELEVALQDVPELGIGGGLSTAEAGLRLRYEIVPEFAPYVGVEYERAFGDTADFRRLAGDDAGGWSLLLGVRTWF